jgi:hypothetical protein
MVQEGAFGAAADAGSADLGQGGYEYACSDPGRRSGMLRSSPIGSRVFPYYHRHRGLEAAFAV